jgi:integrase
LVLYTVVTYDRRGLSHSKIDNSAETLRLETPTDDIQLAHELLEWRYLSPFNQQADWIFASPEMKGPQPYWPEDLLRRYIPPAAERCGIQKTIGWHTFRHSYASQLQTNGEDVKVVQESLRHANSRITLDTYTQASTPAKRRAQTKVVGMIFRKQTQTANARGGN